MVAYTAVRLRRLPDPFPMPLYRDYARCDLLVVNSLRDRLECTNHSADAWIGGTPRKLELAGWIVQTFNYGDLRSAISSRQDLGT